MDNLTRAFIKGCQDQDLRLEESVTKQQLMARAMELADRNGLEVVEDRGFTICKDGGRKRLMWSADINELMVALIAIDWYKND